MNSNDITIKEEFRLPSKGLIYKTPFDPVVRLRSMTVADEMKRLTKSENPYKTMAEVIEGCLLDKLPVPVYDLCIGDYQYLLHRLRVVTYGPEYNLTTRCPKCGEIFKYTINLDDLAVFEYNDSIDELRKFKLPVSGNEIEINFQTPRDLDTIDRNKKELRGKQPDLEYDPTLMLNLESMISSVDGEVMTPTLLRSFIKKLPMKDFNVIIDRAEKLNNKVGVDIRIKANCPYCDQDVNSTFLFTNEFFRPSIN